MQYKRRTRFARCASRERIATSCDADGWRAGLEPGTRRRFLTAALAVFGLWSAGATGITRGQPIPRVLHLNTAFGPPISTPAGTGFFDQLMREVGNRLELTIEIHSPPAERALMLASAGIDDGDGPRIPNLGDNGHYSNLIRVDESLLEVDFVAFTRKSDLYVTNWQSLKGYEVAIVTGWKILERNLSKLSELIKVKDAEHLFLLLKHRRTDVAVIDRYSGIATAEQVGLDDYVILDPPLASTPMYLYLHARHSDLAPAISHVLREMKADGTYNAIRKDTLGHVDDSLSAAY